MPWKDGYTISDEKSLADADVRWPEGKRCAVHIVVDLSVASGATLTFTGMTTLIVYGDISMTGQAVTYSNTPKNLVIAQAADPNNGHIGSFSVGGSAALYAFLYAPQSSVVMSGTGDFYGSMIAGSIDMTGSSAIHYDLAINGGGAISLVK